MTTPTLDKSAIFDARQLAMRHIRPAIQANDIGALRAAVADGATVATGPQLVWPDSALLAGSDALFYWLEARRASGYVPSWPEGESDYIIWATLKANDPDTLRALIAGGWLDRPTAPRDKWYRREVGRNLAEALNRGRVRWARVLAGRWPDLRDELTPAQRARLDGKKAGAR